ncbi:hypothetical protein LG204_10310 [Methylovorus menthalis]|uniref:hypothetical protein n=1 Tax=Methylovorus menthalis TaxID=1002227 RepID=UPI001E61BA19|nr:hypothetical protein [Methylovorus menthalis]MCB4811707.1 hypothetical protein [Methylovorus menthalis]
MAEPSTSLIYLFGASLTGAITYIFAVQDYVMLAALMGTLMGLAISRTSPWTGLFLMLPFGLSLGGFLTPFVMSMWENPALERAAGLLIPLICIGFRKPLIEGITAFIGGLPKLISKWLAKWAGISGGDL